MRQIIECTPNFSEGRRQEVVDQLVEGIQSCGVQVLDVQVDPELNRAVVGFAGDLDSVERAAIAAATLAADLIDMAEHSGEHPRIGSTDVIPFVPIAGASLGDCVALAQRVGERISRELVIPVYLYGAAATRPERERLAVVRETQYEGLRERIAEDPTLEPDFGPKALGPAGATAVGARHPIIALNVYLDSDRLEVADAVARAAREDSGGLQNVHAEAFDIADRGLVQVAISLQRHDLTPTHRVLEFVRREALRYGVAVLSSELVGLVPQSALVSAAAWYLQLEEFKPDQVLENRLLAALSAVDEKGAVPEDFVEAVASDAPTPGGGSVAALAGSLGAALNRMVASLTIGREKYAAVEDDMKRLRARATELQRTLLELIEVDSEAFEAVMAAYRLPRNSTEEIDRRRATIQAALRRATEAPLEIMRRALDVLRLARTAAEMGNAAAISDAGVAAYMAHAAAQSASLNVEINIRGLRDLEEGDRYRQESQNLLRDAGALAVDTDRLVRARIVG